MASACPNKSICPGVLGPLSSLDLAPGETNFFRRPEVKFTFS